MRIEDLIRKEVRVLEKYQVVSPLPISRQQGRGREGVRLDANESPYSIPPDPLAELLARVPLNRYPDPEALELRSTLAELLGISPSRIMVGNGSDELIQLLLLALGDPGSAVLSPVPTFSMYELTSKALGLRFFGIPLGPRFELDLGGILKAIKENQPKLCFLASPNNPTGNSFSEGDILKIAEASQGLVVVDEAYYSYSQRTVLPHVDRYQNLAVLRSLSKIGLAGLRVGYLVAHGALLDGLQKVRLPYNVNALSQAAARFALSKREAIEAQIKQIIGERDRLFEALAHTSGIEVFPSEANFLLFRTKVNVSSILWGLLEEGVLIRDLSHMEGLKNCLRVTVGTPEENDLFLEALRKVLKKLALSQSPEHGEGEVEGMEVL